jgi:hypothetical protein
VDIQHFEIMVNAMLAWSDEAKAPKKDARHGAAPVRDDIDDVDEFVDSEDDDFDDEEAPVVKRAAAWPTTGEAEAELPEAEPAD